MALTTNNAVKKTIEAYQKAGEIKEDIKQHLQEEYTSEIDELLYGNDYRRSEPDDELETTLSTYETAQLMKESYAKAQSDPEFAKRLVEGIDTYLNVAEKVMADGKDKTYPRYLNDYLDLGEGDIDLSRGISSLSTSENKRTLYKEKSDVPVLDIDWAASKYMAPSDGLLPLDAANRFFSWTDYKSEDTSIGNHSVINPLPQFTRYADIRRTTNPHANQFQQNGTKYFASGLGMGRYYSEAIDDNNQSIYLQFGVPEFNSMLRFLVEASHYEDTYLAMHGRYPIEFGITSWISSAAVTRIYPWKAMIIWLGKLVWKTISGFSKAQYYYLNPTMHNYWGTVNTIVTSMAVELGIFVPTLEIVEDTKTAASTKGMGTKINWNQKDMEQLKAFLPGIFGPNTNYIDVYAIATRHQVLANRKRKAIAELYKDVSEAEMENLIGAILGDDDTISKETLDAILRGEDVKTTESSKKGLIGYIKEFRQKVANQEISLFNPFTHVMPAGLNTFGKFLQMLTGVNIDENKRGEAAEAYDRYAGYSSGRLVVTTKAEAEDYANLTKRFSSQGSYYTDEKYSSYKADGGDYESKASYKLNEKTGELEYTGGRITNIGRKVYGKMNVSEREAELLKIAEYEKRRAAIVDGEKKSKQQKENDNSLTVTFTKLIQNAATAIANAGNKSTTTVYGGFDNFMDQAAQVVTAVQMDGGLFLGMRVNPTRGVSDTFSNSYSPIQAGELVKSATGGIRDMRFNLAGGNILPGMDEVLAVAKNVALGTLDGVSFGLTSVVASVLQGAYIDMPDKWDDSSCNLATVSYSMRLTAPYGNAISQLQNIYIPLACLLAGVLPLGTGRSAHTSPYLCSVFSKGIQDIELGMITELSIERATSNLPYSKWRQPLAIDVQFTITDFSKIVTAPVNRSIWAAILQDGVSGMAGQLTTETKLDDYIGVLCGRDFSNARFMMPELGRRMRKGLLRATQTFTNMNAVAFGIGEFTNLPAAIAGVLDGGTQMSRLNRNEGNGMF